ncbi:MAG TPA: DUF6644 family protein [Burkholderiales bacterium]|nr:DUF6644 family protein [Burkholderiales bacterium]
MGALEASALGQAMRQSLYLYPVVETVHIVGLALLFGSIAVLDLRLLGVGRAMPVTRLSRHVLPWTLGSFVLIVPSGLAMFIAHATDFIAHPLFAVKLGLILAAIVNAGIFHSTAMRSVAGWDVQAAPPAAARVAGGLSLVLWAAVIACGRFLAYL